MSFFLSDGKNLSTAWFLVCVCGDVDEGILTGEGPTAIDLQMYISSIVKMLPRTPITCGFYILFIITKALCTESG